MNSTTPVFEVEGMVPDPRVHVFRRLLSIPNELEVLQVDAYVFVSAQIVLVCDTLVCPENAAAMLQAVEHELPGRQLLVINSHADWDHCWGNGAFRGTHTAPIIGHEHCRDRLLSQQARHELQHYQQCATFFRRVELLPPTLTFSRTLKIHGGDLTFELFAAPGHTSDHIALWIPELKLLCAFDAIEYPFPSIENAAAVQGMLNTLQHFLTLHPRHVLCSHSGMITPSLIDNTLTYLHEAAQRCQTYISKTIRSSDKIEAGMVAQTIGFPFDEASSYTMDGAAATHLANPTYYRQTHEDNMLYILQWMKGQASLLFT